MTKLLIVDDEEKIRSLIVNYAKFEGYETDEAENGMQAIEMCEQNKYDLIIMDIMMPVLDGFSAAKKIHAQKNVPIIMLSARGEEYDRIHGFEVGCDDYVVKPFSPRELMLRIEAVLRRGIRDEREVFEFDKLKIDAPARKVFVNGEKVELSPKEFEILLYMVENKGIAISREKFISALWGYDYDGYDRTLDAHIKMLRKNLGECASYIETVRGVGYRFEA